MGEAEEANECSTGNRPTNNLQNAQNTPIRNRRPRYSAPAKSKATTALLTVFPMANADASAGGPPANHTAVL